MTKKYERLDPVLEQLVETGQHARLTFWDGTMALGYVNHSEGYPYRKPYRIGRTMFCKSQVMRIEVEDKMEWKSLS